MKLKNENEKERGKGGFFGCAENIELRYLIFAQIFHIFLASKATALQIRSILALLGLFDPFWRAVTLIQERYEKSEHRFGISRVQIFKIVSIRYFRLNRKNLHFFLFIFSSSFFIFIFQFSKKNYQWKEMICMKFRNLIDNYQFPCVSHSISTANITSFLYIVRLCDQKFYVLVFLTAD